MGSETILAANSPQSGDSDAKIILERYLIPGETLQWYDKPQRRWKQDLKGIGPVLILFLILFVFFVVNFLSQPTNKTPAAYAAPVQQNNAPHNEGPPSPAGIVFVSAFVAAFLSFWCYMMFRGLGGHKLLNLFSLSKTYYGLTDQRLLMVSGKKEFRVLSYHLHSALGLRLREEPDGVGTINLGPKDRFNNPFQGEDSPPLILKNIPRAAYVFSLIFKVQDKLLRQ
jgi:hypothetical protein